MGLTPASDLPLLAIPSTARERHLQYTNPPEPSCSHGLQSPAVARGGYITLQMRSKDTELQVLWFQSDPDLLQSLIKHGLVIDSHKSLPITQSLPFHPGRGQRGLLAQDPNPPVLLWPHCYWGCPCCEQPSENRLWIYSQEKIKILNGFHWREFQAGRVCPECLGRVCSALLCSQSLVLCIFQGKPCPVSSVWLLSEDVQVRAGVRGCSSCSQSHTVSDGSKWWGHSSTHRSGIEPQLSVVATVALCEGLPLPLRGDRLLLVPPAHVPPVSCGCISLAFGAPWLGQVRPQVEGRQHILLSMLLLRHVRITQAVVCFLFWGWGECVTKQLNRLFRETWIVKADLILCFALVPKSWFLKPFPSSQHISRH